ncbi:MAG TPA: alpha/beta hydrolase [Anaerolineae bacterium]|nr:alpha/beta hydrolase [Anaerolineae bacterium]
MEKININGIELAYERVGKGTPLILLHGFPLDHDAWEQVIPLLENDFDLIVPDLRGFGSSTTTHTPYTMDDIASDLAGLLDHLKVEKTAIAGHSMGGYAALAFARIYSERVSGLGLVSTQALADPPDRKEGRYKSAAEVEEKGIDGVVTAMTTKFSSDVQIQRTARKMMEGQQPAAYIGALKAMAERFDSTSLLASSAYPIVIIHGTKDVLIPIERGHEMKRMISHARFVELYEAGHLPMLEAPQETADGLKHLA